MGNFTRTEMLEIKITMMEKESVKFDERLKIEKQINEMPPSDFIEKRKLIGVASGLETDIEELRSINKKLTGILYPEW